MPTGSSFLLFRDGPLALAPPVVNTVGWPPPDRIAVQPPLAGLARIVDLDGGAEPPAGTFVYRQVARSSSEPTTGSTVGAEYVLDSP